MAYREFHFEKIYEAPNVNILAEGLVSGAAKSAEAISGIFRGLADQQRAKRLAADQYKFDLGQGKFENDDKIFYQRGLAITDQAKNNIRTTGRISAETERDQQLATVDKKSSDWQYAAFEKFEKDIVERAAKDKYYDPEVDRNKLRIAAYGENNDVYYGTRGDRLETFAQAKGTDPKSLKGKFYTFDYVGTFREKEKTRSTGSPTSESTTYDKTPFLNEQGAPGITINHAKEYMNSRADGSVARWIESLVTDDMDADVRYMKQRAPEFKGMNDDEIKLYLKAHPEENQYNKKDFATRVIEKAQQELAEAAATSNKIDYTTKVDKTLTGGLYNNDAIGHSYTTHNDVVGLPTGVSDPVGSAFRMNANNMPGGTLRIGKGAKVGQAIPVDMNPRYSYNIRTGKTSTNKGTTSYNLTGYQLAAFNNEGKLVPMDAQSLDQIPNSAFKNMSPKLEMALRGYTVDYGNKLGEIASHQSQLDDELADAIASKDYEKQEQIQMQLNNLNGLRQQMNRSKSEFSDDDLISSFKRNGISTTSIKQDMIIKASQADVDLINKNLTQGLNLNDQSKWSDEMLQLDAAYRKRYQQAAAAGFSNSKSEDTKAPAKGKSKTATFNNEEYEVPSGRVLVQKPDGSIVTIPESQRQQAIFKGFTIIE